MQSQWNEYVEQLSATMNARDISANTEPLRRAPARLYAAGRKVSDANAKMAERLSRIVREQDA